MITECYLCKARFMGKMTVSVCVFCIQKNTTEKEHLVMMNNEPTKVIAKYQFGKMINLRVMG